jgi:hypothetical protein
MKEKTLWPNRLEIQNFIEEPITQTLKLITKIQIFRILCWWHCINAINENRCRVLDFISSYLSDGKARNYT